MPKIVSTNNKDLPGRYKTHTNHPGFTRAQGIFIVTSATIGSVRHPKDTFSTGAGVIKDTAPYHPNYPTTDSSAMEFKGIRGRYCHDVGGSHSMFLWFLSGRGVNGAHPLQL